MSQATIDELVNELVTLFKDLPEFINKGFATFDIDDVEAVASDTQLPIVCVSYEGTNPKESINAQAKQSRSAAFNTVSVSVVIALEYASALAKSDSKKSATDLLDATRSVALGYKGVNTRPWRFAGEAPVESRMEGVIFYGQMWETDVPILGTHQQ